MKKLLAMVLALVMTLSLAVSASAFKDDKDISADYAEAVAVLDGMGVFKGYEDGSFKPTGDITRAEVATIIYRIYTGDVAKSDKSGMYATYNKFSDMAGAGWAAGYIGYCANAELVKGYPDGTFKPSGKITGYEVLAMILRAVGYDKNGEFSGADWALNVAKYAEQLGILKNVAKTTNLGAPATRELIAEMLFQAIQKDQVTYTPAFGYVTDKALKLGQESLGYKNFKLVSGEGTDDWGRPTTVWAKDANDNAKYDAKDTTEYATVVATADASFNVETSQCDICDALGVKKTTTVVDTYTNGVLDTKDVTYTATATKAMVGAQGQQLEYYKVDGGYRLVVIDTYLAKVADVVAEKLDAKGHVTRDDYMKLTGYTAADKTEPLYVAGNDYAEDDYVLVNVNEKVTDKIVGVGEVKLVEIVGKAESFEGAQSKNWYNAAKHTIDDKDYNDAVRFYLDAAGTTKTAKFTWFLDQFGNLIGDAEIDNSNYAVIKDIVWIVGKPGHAEATLVFMDGKEDTVTVDTMDGLTAPNGLSGAFDKDCTGWEVNLSDAYTQVGFDGEDEYVYVSSDSKYNGEFEGMALYKVNYNKDGNVDLVGYDFVDYDKNVTVDTKASLIANTESGKLNINDNTEFLVRSGEGTKADPYTYTSYNRNNLPQYAALSAEIYYTIGTDGFVNRVYIKSAADAASFGDHLFVTTKSYYKVTGDKETYKMDVIIDGEEQTICANKSVMEDLAANKGKMLHVTWEKNSAKGYYGFAASVSLVNESSDCDDVAGYLPDEGDCDYVTGNAKIKGQTIVSNHFNWTITSNTKFVGAKDLNDIDLEDNGVWVVASGSKYASEAAYVYVGEKLGESVALTVTAKDGTVTVDKDDATKITVTSKKDATSDKLTYSNSENAMIGAPGDNYGIGLVEETVYNNNTSRAITVENEAGTDYEDYTVTLVWETKSADTSLKSVYVDNANVEIAGGRTDAANCTPVYLGAKDKFTITATANSAAATVEMGHGDSVANAVADLHATSTLTVTDTTAHNGGYVVIRVTAESGAKTCYVYAAAEAPASGTNP